MTEPVPRRLPLQEALAEVRNERRERAQLGAPAPYTRIYY